MRKLRKSQKRLVIGLALAAAGLLTIGVLASLDYAVLEPKGVIASQQRDLLVFATILSLLIIIPVFVLTFQIVRTYRVGAKKRAAYTPEWDHDHKLESLWWGVPAVLILVLSVITWQSSHALDPAKPINASSPPLVIQVVALEWKWLFIYPEQHVASINSFHMPLDRPVRFEITADAPMNSFWIPQLGGQIYAMNGMSTKLNLMATSIGDYRGVSANLSGEGFAGMDFTAKVVSQSDFNLWVRQARQSNTSLDAYSYGALAQPSTDDKVATYALRDDNLFGTIIDQFGQHGHGGGMAGER